MRPGKPKTAFLFARVRKTGKSCMKKLLFPVFVGLFSKRRLTDTVF